MLPLLLGADVLGAGDVEGPPTASSGTAAVSQPSTGTAAVVSVYDGEASVE